jgi:hypothetical protein
MISAAFTLFAYSMTIVCAYVVAKRSSNWRIRLLAVTLAMLPLCQGVILLGDHKIWVSAQIRDIAESMELLVSALCLTGVHLLNRENVNRKNTDARLRITELMPWRASKPSLGQTLT